MTEGGRASSARGRAAPKSKAQNLTQSQIVSEVSEGAGLTRSQVKEAFAALEKIMARELRAGHTVNLMGLMKVVTKHKPAVAAHPGRNPFTGESIMVRAKPAHKAVRVRPLKALKELV